MNPMNATSTLLPLPSLLLPLIFPPLPVLSFILVLIAEDGFFIRCFNIFFHTIRLTGIYLVIADLASVAISGCFINAVIFHLCLFLLSIIYVRY